MRVAFCAPSLGEREGQGSADLELVRRIAADGHQVDALAGNVPAWLASEPGVTVVPTPRLPRWQLGNQVIGLVSTTLRLRRGRYDIIHADAGVTLRRADVVACHTLNDTWLGMPAELWREPGLRGANQAAATRFKARLELRQYRAARAVVANSPKTAADLTARGIDPAKITVVPFGVDAGRFRPPTEAERTEARAALSVPPGAFAILAVGAHGPRKGLPELLEAMTGAQGEHLVVAGDLRGGAWVRDAQARRLSVTMPGKLDDVRLAYWAADVLAYPSRYDAFGMAVLEAMACGLPVVVSRDAGVHEIVRDAGFVLTDVSSSSLRSALDALRADDVRRAAMGATGRAIAEERTWDKAGATLLDLYARLAAPVGNGRSSAV